MDHNTLIDFLCKELAVMMKSNPDLSATEAIERATDLHWGSLLDQAKDIYGTNHTRLAPPPYRLTNSDIYTALVKLNQMRAPK